MFDSSLVIGISHKQKGGNCGAISHTHKTFPWCKNNRRRRYAQRAWKKKLSEQVFIQHKTFAQRFSWLKKNVKKRSFCNMKFLTRQIIPVLILNLKKWQLNKGFEGKTGVLKQIRKMRLRTLETGFGKGQSDWLIRQDNVQQGSARRVLVKTFYPRRGGSRPEPVCEVI